MASFSVERGLSPWRKIALSTWASAGEASIYGWVDVDATRLGAYVESVRASTGVRLTVTHLVGKAAALALAESPSANAVVSLGRIKRRDAVDVFFSVVTEGGKGLAGQKLRGVDRMSVLDVARGLSREVGRIRDAGDSDLQRSQRRLFRLPSAALGAVMHAVGAATFDLGLDLEAHGVPSDPFGSVVVTNVGVFGIERGLGPLIPHGRTALITVGKITDRVLAVNGKPTVRPVLTLGGTFDHRVVDGHTLGKISARLREILEDPARTLGTPSGVERRPAAEARC